MDENTKKELQSAAFERLIDHLRNRKDVFWEKKIPQAVK